MRLHQFLSKTGVFPTKDIAKDAIKQGEIRIGNKTIFSQQHTFNEKKERVYYKDNLLNLKRTIILAINKPRGYICAKLSIQEKKLKKKSIYELLSQDMQHLSCVGRLDEESEGLLLMTNDGNLLQKIISKDTQIVKRYITNTKKEVKEDELKKLRAGVVIILEESGHETKYLTKPCEVKKISKKTLEIRLREGKKRQIRRMIHAINNDVIDLKRIQIGNFSIKQEKIPLGEYREIRKEDIINI